MPDLGADTFARPGANAPNDPSSDGVLGGAVRATSLVTLGSRLGGLARDVIIVRIFGATAIGSAFAAAFAVPNLFRRLLGEGALSAAFLPEYARAAANDPELARRLASLTVGMLAQATARLTLLVQCVLLVVVWLAPTAPARTLSLQLIVLMLPFMPLVCVAAILAGMLQVHGRFGPAASGPVILNAFIIATGAVCMLTGTPGGPIAATAIGVATVLSGATQCLWFARLLRPHVRWTCDWEPARPAARRMLSRFVPVVIGLGALQIGALVDMLIAMWPNWFGPRLGGVAYPLDEASNAVLVAAQRLYQFPLGVFGIAVATAVFPLLSRHAEQPGLFVSTLRRGVRLSLFIGVPASAGLLLVRRDACAVLYSGNGGFDPAAVERCAAVLAGYAGAVWAYSLNHVLTRGLYARGDTRTPMRVALASVAANAALNLVLIWPLREAGLAWATAATAAAQCAVLLHLSRRRCGRSLLDRETLGGVARAAAATTAMAAAVGALLWMWPEPGSWREHLWRLLASCASGSVVYPATAALLRAPELRWLLRRA